MSGHSKWSQIKRQKAITDGKRGAVFTKLAKAITVAVKTGGGPNPDYNFKLKTAIDKAKEALVPKANIERAIDKGSGKDDADLKENIYEGYLPGGVAVMIFTATDNVNRTYGDLRTIFSKADGAIGTSGSVAYLFEKKGVMKLRKPENFDNKQEEKILELAMDSGFDDMSIEDEIYLFCKAEDIETNSKVLENKIKENNILLEIISSDSEFIPLSSVEVNNEDEHANILKTLEAFEDHDDVISVVANLA